MRVRKFSNAENERGSIHKLCHIVTPPSPQERFVIVIFKFSEQKSDTPLVK
jgi:hypothetical protein